LVKEEACRTAKLTVQSNPLSCTALGSWVRSGAKSRLRLRSSAKRRGTRF
jgi:hypothetical protein